MIAELRRSCAAMVNYTAAESEWLCKSSVLHEIIQYSRFFEENMPHAIVLASYNSTGKLAHAIGVINNIDPDLHEYKPNTVLLFIFGSDGLAFLREWHKPGEKQCH
jgi:hypothetical protein